MNMSEMVENPVSTHKYGIYDVDTLPRAVLCVSVKNQYDESRLSIARKYKPTFIAHFQTISEHTVLQPVYYYGIEFCKSFIRSY